MTDPTRGRRALTNVGGDIDTAGDREAADRLAHALAVEPATDADDDPARGHVHGFHTYPARMHPTTAARLVAAFAAPGAKVLDPFCGSGTVLVEAMLAGRRPHGTDLNPLAVRLSRCKTKPHTQAEFDHFLARAAECVEHAAARRRAKAGATRRFPHEDVALFEPHVLLELDSLRDKIDTFKDDPARIPLSLVLSSLLVKLSRRKGDTSGETATRKLAAGFPSRLFVQKTEELVGRFAAFNSLLPFPPPPAAWVALDDATKLRSLPPGGVDAVITSPPYAGTYDYLAHHALRLRWLGLDGSMLARGELGTRAKYQQVTPADSRETWAREVARFLLAVADALPAGGPVALVMADSAVGPFALRADEIVADTARECGFVPVARASQARSHYHGPTRAAFRDGPRREHAILLRKA